MLVPHLENDFISRFELTLPVLINSILYACNETNLMHYLQFIQSLYLYTFRAC
jgi:hypothetical protein